MDRTVIYSASALADLQAITEFIAADNVQAAIQFSNRLVDLAESLRRLPERGRRVKGWTNVRVLSLPPYLIFYHLPPGTIRIEVLRFWHGAQNPDTLDLQPLV